jgi:hypothetical protein
MILLALQRPVAGVFLSPEVRDDTPERCTSGGYRELSVNAVDPLDDEQ